MSSELPQTTMDDEKSTTSVVRRRTRAAFYLVAQSAMAPHYNVFQKTTFRPIERIIRSTTSEEARKHVLEWCKRKTKEAQYVQVAGAVMFASVVSVLGWDSVTESYWLGPACFYACILLSLASIFAAAQQFLVLPEQETILAYSHLEIEHLRVSLLNNREEEPSLLVLFSWQTPIMLMGYSVAFFVIGLCTVVITPLAHQPEWGPAAKTVVLFLTILMFIAISSVITTRMVWQFRAS